MTYGFETRGGGEAHAMEKTCDRCVSIPEEGDELLTIFVHLH